MRKWKPYGDRADPTAWLAISNAYPTSSGAYRCAPSWSTSGTAAAGPATPGTQLNAWCGKIVSGTSVGFVGTTTKLYQIDSLTTGSFTDKSKGGGYTNTATSWCFANFGNITIATNYVDAVQSRDSSGSSAFADLAGTPPKAKIVLTQSNCVLLFNYNDGTAYADGWWASDVGDHTTWTPAASNDAANGRILQRPGPITAAAAFKDEVIVFKADSIYRMRYVGAPFYWTVNMISDSIGAAYMGSVVNCGSFLLFTGQAGAFIFDGQSLQPVGDGFVTSTGFSLVSAGRGASQGGIFYGHEGIALIQSAGDDATQSYVFNVQSGAWGQLLPKNTSGETITASTGDVYYIPLGGSFDAIAALGSGANSFGQSGLFMIGLGENPCVLKSGSATTGDYTMQLQTSLFGDFSGMINVSRVNPIWSYSNGAGWTHSASASDYQCSLFLDNLPNASGTQTSAVNVSGASKRFDINHTARYITINFAATADCEVADLVPAIKSAGTD